MSRRVVLVGNAPMHEDVAGSVDGADHVVRFNKACGLDGRTGSRTDELYLVNHGGQMAEWLADGRFLESRAVRAATTVVLPIPFLPGHVSPTRARELGHDGGEPVDADRINHGEEARRRLERDGRVVVRVGASEYRDVRSALGEPPPGAGEHFPSTGFIALFRTLSYASDRDRIELCGFTFEGWRGHSWEAERRWVGARADEGRLVVRPVR